MSSAKRDQPKHYALEGVPDEDDNPQEFTILDPKANVSTHWITIAIEDLIPLHKKR